MSWEVIRGRYEQGQVKPLQGLPHCEGKEVLILIPAQDSPSRISDTWQRIKEEMTKEMPELLSMTEDERRQEFERLSNLMAERMPHESVEAFERAMRGDDYALVGY